MSIFHKAKGGTNLGIFIIRLFIGLTFLVAGITKLYDLEGFVNFVKSTGVLSDNLAFILGFSFPFFELVFGALYILGLFTPVSSFVLAIMNLFILIAFDVPSYKFHFIALACTISTLFMGAGSFSIDVFFEKKKRTITVSQDTPKESPTPEVKDASFTNIEH
jgi:putative oxidoreductase